MATASDNKKRRVGWWWKIPLGVLLLLLAVLAVLLLNIDTIARIQINKALDRYLVAGGELAAVDIRLIGGSVALSGLTIHPPPNFSEKPPLTLGTLTVDVTPLSIFTGKIVVEQVRLEKMALSLLRSEKGQLNILEMVTPAASDSAPADDQEKAAPPWIPAILVNSVMVNDLSVDLLDRMTDESWSAGLHFDMTLTGLKLNDLMALEIQLDAIDAAVSEITVDQLPGFSDNPLLTIDNITLGSRGIDLATGNVFISEVGLDTLSASVERNADREINLLKLANSWLPTAMEGEDDKQVPAASPDSTAAPALKIPAIKVDNIELKSISAQLLDSIDGQPWRAGFDGLDIQVSGVEVGDLAEQAIALASFDLALKGIAVDQPPGFGEDPLLAVNNITLGSRGIDLATGNVFISEVGLDTLSASVERNADREINLLKLANSWLPTAMEGEDDKPERADSPDPPAGPAWDLPTVVVDNIELKSIRAQLLASIDDQPWRAGLDNLDIHVTGVEVGEEAKPAISMASFNLDLKDVAVDQPPGFGNDKLFGLERFAIISEKADRTGKELVIKKVQLQGLTSSVTMPADGLTNLQVLSKELLGKDEKSQPPREEATEAKEASSPAIAMQPVLFEKILLDGGPVTFRDELFAEEPLTVSLDNINLAINQLRLFSDDAGVDPASASLSFEFDQPGELPTAYFGTLANVGPVGDDIPMVNSQFRMVGLKLDTLGSLVPPATRTALGATGLDGALSLAMDADSINLNAFIITDRGIKYKGLRVHGSLDNPVVSPGPVLTGVLSRVSDGLVNIGKSGLKSGADIAEGGAHAVKEIGVGAVKVGANLGKSLFETTAGMVTLDKEKVKAGASGTTKGTVDLTKDSVKGTGKAAGGGLKSSATELKGEERVKAWEHDIPNRYRKSIQHAQGLLAEMPYPPVTK